MFGRLGYVGYGISQLVLSAFRTDEKRELRDMRGLISELKFDIKLEGMSTILCSVYEF